MGRDGNEAGRFEPNLIGRFCSGMSCSGSKQFKCMRQEGSKRSDRQTDLATGSSKQFNFPSKANFINALTLFMIKDFPPHKLQTN